MNIVAYSFLCKNVDTASKLTEAVVTPRTADSDKHLVESLMKNKHMKVRKVLRHRYNFKKKKKLKKK